ncbi:MAG: superoxide dismutase family protein [Deinococcus sp.]|nr:superoxide dismutase family protein [Deinococcus sp.]
MRRNITALLTLGLAAAGGFAPVLAAQPAPTAATPAPLGARAALITPDGQPAGEVRFEQAGDGVKMLVRASGLTPGQHGMHIHEFSACAPGVDAATNAVVPFGGAGPHFDPAMSHNHDKPAAPNELGHGGDLPMVQVGADGTGRASFVTDKISLRGTNGILNRTIVIHANADDYASDPAGKSGGRVLCGTVQRQGLSVRDYPLPGWQTFPEGVTYDAARGLLFTGSAQTGDIYAVNAESGQTSLYSRGGALGRRAALGLKVDSQGRLWIAGGAEGTVSVLDRYGVTLKVLETPKSPAAFINDLALAPDGSVYVTDSRRPVIYRVSPDLRLSAWLNLAQTPIRYGEGDNLNGIVATPDGRALLIAQSNTGDLWRVDLRTKAVTRVMTGLNNADGLVLRGQDLYVARNRDQLISRVRLSAGWTSGQVAAEEPLAGLRFPATLALVGSDLVVTQAQLDRREGGTPETPFRLTRFGAF